MLRASLPAFAADFPVRHGRVSGYQRGCRCAPCVAANRAAGRAWRARQPAKVRTPRARTAGHGVSWYANGVCRCEVCRSAGTAARAVSRARRRAQVVAVAGCPRCGAPAGLPCQGRAGPRVALHRERWTAVGGERRDAEGD